MTSPAFIPIYVLTGFLGSGKTTLLRALLHDHAFQDTAVIVNEFGEIGLDHELLETPSESMIVLRGGCLCCTVREDLASTIRLLMEGRAAGKLPPFKRVVIETTGIADPVPVIFTLRSDPRVTHLCRLQGVIVTIDAQNAIATLNRNVESVRQAALADRIVISKTDVVPGEQTDRVRAIIARLNPSASVLTSASCLLRPAQLLDDLEHNASDSLGEGGVRFIKADAESGAVTDGAGMAGHAGAYRSISWEGTVKIDWSSFGIWLTMLLHAHGDRVLRVKGILDVEGAAGPVAIHAVQHVVHPPIHLGSWPSVTRRSRFILIVCGLSESSVRESFTLFMRLSGLAHDASLEGFRPGGSGGMVAGRPVRRRMAPAWMKG